MWDILCDVYVKLIINLYDKIEIIDIIVCVGKIWC